MAAIQKRETANGSPRWRVYWREKGERKSVTFRSESAAKKFRGQVEAVGGRDPRTPAIDPAGLTVEQWGQRSLAVNDASDHAKQNYSAYFANYITPHMGDMYLDEVTPEVAAKWTQILADTKSVRTKKPLSPKTRANIISFASSLFEDARRNHKIEHNPFANIKLPRARQKDRKATFLTPEEFQKLLAKVDEHYKPFVTFLAATGMRWGEATALTVGDVDLAGKRVRVQQAWKRTNDGYQVGDPKTRKSMRTIALDDSTVQLVKPLTQGRDSDELLFTLPAGTRIHHSNFARDCWHPAVSSAKLGKKPRIHDLRHSHVSWLVAAGVPLPAIQERLGHASISTTINEYGHLLPELDQGIRDAVAKALDQ